MSIQIVPGSLAIVVGRLHLVISSRKNVNPLVGWCWCSTLTSDNLFQDTVISIHSVCNDVSRCDMMYAHDKENN